MSIIFNLDEADEVRLKELAAEAGMSTSAYAREAVLKAISNVKKSPPKAPERASDDWRARLTRLKAGAVSLPFLLDDSREALYSESHE